MSDLHLRYRQNNRQSLTILKLSTINEQTLPVSIDINMLAEPHGQRLLSMQLLHIHAHIADTRHTPLPKTPADSRTFTT